MLIAQVNKKALCTEYLALVVTEVNAIVSLREMFFRIGLKYSNFFEPFAKYGISYYLKGELKKYAEEGAISNYTLKTKRLGKWHYKVDVDLDLTPRQLAFLVQRLTKQLRNYVGR